MIFCTAARIYYLDLIKGLKISFDLFFLIIFFQFIYAIELSALSINNCSDSFLLYVFYL